MQSLHRNMLSGANVRFPPIADITLSDKVIRDAVIILFSLALIAMGLFCVIDACRAAHIGRFRFGFFTFARDSHEAGHGLFWFNVGMHAALGVLVIGAGLFGLLHV